MSKLPDDDIMEGLASLFLWWYGNHRCVRNVLRHGWNETEEQGPLDELPSHCLEEAWRERWFAKGGLTAKVDTYMDAHFAWLLNEPSLRSYKPSKVWEKLAMVVLFDQVTRNVRRSTPEAFASDAIALPLALELASLDGLPFHFQATVCICLSHAESLSVQHMLGAYLRDVCSSTVQHAGLRDALVEIHEKHAERVREFGRFPERNKILQRKSTAREAAYLLQLGDSTRM